MNVRARRSNWSTGGIAPLGGCVVGANEPVAIVAGGPGRESFHHGVVVGVGANKVEGALRGKPAEVRYILARLQSEIARHAVAIEIVHVAEAGPRGDIPNDAQVDAVVRCRVGEEFVDETARLGEARVGAEFGILQETAADE